MAGVGLPELPRGREFEELVAATLQSSGLFVERDLTQREDIERERVEVLQLDVVTTDYGTRPPTLRLIEAKTGDWGFKDVFKIKGWMSYLDIRDGHLVVSEVREKAAAYEKISSRIGVNVIRIQDARHPEEGLAPLVPESASDPADIAVWRFVYWVEREMLEWVRIRRQSCPDVRRYQAILDHAFGITSGIFFTSTVAERVESLYKTFSENRNLAGKCGQEMEKKAFDDEEAQIPQSVFRRTFYKCEFNEVQVACFMEHWARLMLLKAAVDYLCYKADGEVSKAEKTITLKFGERKITMPLASFPHRFEAAVEALGKEPHFRRYPLVWQWFLGPFGGFILTDYEDRDIERLAQKAGIPSEAIPDAFAAFDKLFPREGGWFWEHEESRTRNLILYPAVLKGIGAHYRRVVFTEDGKFEKLELKGRYTLADLLRWTKATINLLSD